MNTAHFFRSHTCNKHVTFYQSKMLKFKCSHFLSKAKRKKASAPEKPVKKQKSGETSKPSGSAKSDKNGDDNMFQVQVFFL